MKKGSLELACANEEPCKLGVLKPFGENTHCRESI
jgi:hypothetical protein